MKTFFGTGNHYEIDQACFGTEDASPNTEGSAWKCLTAYRKPSLMCTRVPGVLDVTHIHGCCMLMACGSATVLNGVSVTDLIVNFRSLRPTTKKKDIQWKKSRYDTTVAKVIGSAEENKRDIVRMIATRIGITWKDSRTKRFYGILTRYILYQYLEELARPSFGEERTTEMILTRATPKKNAPTSLYDNKRIGPITVLNYWSHFMVSIRNAAARSRFGELKQEDINIHVKSWQVTPKQLAMWWKNGDKALEHGLETACRKALVERPSLFDEYISTVKRQMKNIHESENAGELLRDFIVANRDLYQREKEEAPEADENEIFVGAPAEIVTFAHVNADEEIIFHQVEIETATDDDYKEVTQSPSKRLRDEQQLDRLSSSDADHVGDIRHSLKTAPIALNDGKQDTQYQYDNENERPRRIIRLYSFRNIEKHL
jgi:hypothetical protein